MATTTLHIADRPVTRDPGPHRHLYWTTGQGIWWPTHWTAGQRADWMRAANNAVGGRGNDVQAAAATCFEQVRSPTDDELTERALRAAARNER